MNVTIAKAAVSGKLDSNPFMQGILMQLLRRISKQERGITSHRGRLPSCTQTEHDLISSAAFTFALAGGNQTLALELGQNLTPPRLRLEDLEGMGLPNPFLALRDQKRLESNFDLIDKVHERLPQQHPRRLIAAIDCTYLQRGFCQVKCDGVAGLIGAPWRVGETDDDRSWMPLAKIPENGLQSPKAALILETLLWDPMAKQQLCLSAGAVPMSLKAETEEKAKRNHGKFETCPRVWYYMVFICFHLNLYDYY